MFAECKAQLQSHDQMEETLWGSELWRPKVMVQGTGFDSPGSRPLSE